MLSSALLPEPVGRLLFSVLLISSLRLSLCQLSPDSPLQGRDTQVSRAAEFKDALLDYGPRPTRLDTEADRLDEIQAMMAEKNLQTAKRYSNFVRVGRGGGGGGTFLRIGKSSGLSDESDSFLDSVQSQLLANVGYPNKRHMHRFIRIGRDMAENGADDQMLEGDDYSPFARLRKSPSSFVRIGRAPNKFLRIGKSPSSFVRIGRAPNKFLRIGRAPNKFVRIGKSPSSFVRIGKSPSSFVRIGRILSDTPNIFNDKRPSSFVRIGRSAAKRPSSFVRIGKSPSVLDSLVKRPSSFVRIGKSAAEKSFQDDIDLKRASSFVRIGKSNLLDKDTDIDNIKRASSFVRIGKSHQQQDNDVPTTDKRAGNFLRIGRLTTGPGGQADKRGFVRIGKKEDSPKSNKAGSATPGSPSMSDESVSDENPAGDRGPINLANRASAFVRIGKIPSSAFVRIGKNSDVMLEQEPSRVYSFNRGSRGGHSSFVRIG